MRSIIENWPTATSIISLVIAFVAAFRPELQSRLHPRKIDILLADSLRLEIGFAALGPSVALLGIINNQHVKTLVNKFRLRLRLPGNADEFVFTPILNRERALNRAFAGGEEGRGTLWLPFLIESDSAVPFDVVFRHDSAGVELSQVGSELDRSWTAYLTWNAQQNVAAWADSNPAYAETKRKAFAKTLFESSANWPFMLSAKRKIMEQFIWSAGRAECALEIEAFGSRRFFSTKFSFTLSSDDINHLSQNVNQLIAAVCKQVDPNAPYNFAYPELALERYGEPARDPRRQTLER